MTPPQELFRELTDIGSLVFNMLAGPQVAVRRWPAYYMVYLEVDRICWEVSQATAALARGFMTPGGAADSQRIEAVNAGLGRLDGHVRALVDQVARIERQGLMNHGRPALKAIVERHFAPESTWYVAFRDHYCSGRVSGDGRILERRVLQIDPQPDISPMGGNANELVERQVFEVESAQARNLLGRTSRSVQTRLNHLYTALGESFVARCPSVRELLHPRMT
jgi:hypothetical protein